MRRIIPRGCLEINKPSRGLISFKHVCEMQYQEITLYGPKMTAKRTKKKEVFTLQLAQQKDL